jgi:hypothetical protein
MAKKTQNTTTTVIEVLDRHDNDYMIEAVVEAASTGGAHVYVVPDAPLNKYNWYGAVFVVSARSLTQPEIQTAYQKYDEECAREAQ